MEMTDICSPNKVSDYLLCESRERGEILTNLKLQKLLYYAQAWYLVVYGKPLFSEDFQAWVHGPVLPSQYQRFRSYSWRPIDCELLPPDISDDLTEFFDQILDVFGVETANGLERMTHEEAPWINARIGIDRHATSTEVIPKSSMKKYYSSL